MKRGDYVIGATWTPGALATDLAGNAAATTVDTETDLDNDFWGLVTWQPQRMLQDW